MSALSRAKARFEANRFDSRLRATKNLEAKIPNFNLSGWGERVRTAYLDQWFAEPMKPQFDWVEVFARHNDPDRLDICVWSGDRLSGLALGTTTGEAVEMRFVEGDPRPDCPLKGRRILIFLEAATCYAQVRGRRELRIRPINERLEHLYTQTYGFVLETLRNGDRYYRKGI